MSLSRSTEYSQLLEAAVHELQRNVAAAEQGAAVLIAELLRARRVAVSRWKWHWKKSRRTSTTR